MAYIDTTTGMRLQLLLDRQAYRNIALESCKTQAEKDKLLDRWSIEDAAETIAHAISHQQRRRGLFV